MFVDNLGMTRQTTSKHLKELEVIGLLEEKKIRNSKFYINCQVEPKNVPICSAKMHGTVRNSVSI